MYKTQHCSSQASSPETCLAVYLSNFLKPCGIVGWCTAGRLQSRTVSDQSHATSCLSAQLVVHGHFDGNNSSDCHVPWRNGQRIIIWTALLYAWLGKACVIC